jgi:translation initiation factor 2 subunit 2
MMKYEDLLDTVYEKLPKKAVTKERFEIPRFSSMVQGNQTFIKNFNEVAGILRRDPNHLLKYIAKELATAGNFDGKRGILNGKFKEEQINAKLDAYVAEFVICKECKKPDTDLITFEGIKYKRCEVCGARSPVRQV